MCGTAIARMTELRGKDHLACETEIDKRRDNSCELPQQARWFDLAAGSSARSIKVVMWRSPRNPSRNFQTFFFGTRTLHFAEARSPARHRSFLTERADSGAFRSHAMSRIGRYVVAPPSPVCYHATLMSQAVLFLSSLLYSVGAPSQFTHPLLFPSPLDAGVFRKVHRHSLRTGSASYPRTTPVTSYPLRP